MLDAVKRYATAILLIHVVLLALVVLFVVGAARKVQVTARDEAQVRSQERLELLADQTARGLESQYGSILSDLDVILRDDSAATLAATFPATVPATQESFGRGVVGGRGGRGGGGRGGRGGFIRPRMDLTQPINVNETTLSTIYKQLKSRVSQIFLVNLNNQRVAITLPDTNANQATSVVLARSNIEWLRKLKDVEMSGFITGGASLQGYHLIAVPAVDVAAGLGGNSGSPLGGAGAGRGGPGGNNPNGPGGPGDRGGFGDRGGPGFQGGPGGGFQPPAGMGNPGEFGLGPQGAMAPQSQPGNQPAQFAVVVVVPIERVREQFLDPLNGQQNHEANAMLVNNDGQVLAASTIKPGTNFLDKVDPALRSDFASLITVEHTEPVSRVFEKPFTLDGNTIAPQIMASAQLEVPNGHHWTLLISSPLSETEAGVNKVVYWSFSGSLVVTLAMTAILVSTAYFMIRGRVRLERTRHEMLTRELQQARHIQLAWLPDHKSVPAGIEVSAANLPASHISGDFYNWFSLPSLMQKTGVSADSPDAAASGKIALVIGDVTGHGMAAAFLMATTQLLVRMTLSRYQDAGRCLKEVNKQLCMQSGSGFKGQFVTMLVMILDTQRNTIQVASAGHPTPLIENEGVFSSLELEPQLVLGVNSDEDYHAKTFRLDAGASVILYTDGVVEAESPAGAQYGTENLLKLLQSQNKSNAQGADPIDPSERIRGILEDVKRFCATRELLDDVTLLAVKTSPSPIPAAT